MIRIDNLTRRFTNGKGIFNVSFEVKEGEVFGFLGPNGSGKSTTIRHLLGYMKPQKGSAVIDGYDTWKNQAKARGRIGYLPGEIAFLEGMTGSDFLDMMAGMQGITDKSKRTSLIQRLQFDPDTPIRKMSKGMKQKVGIVATFMHDPDVYILDEPTSGLDPLMQKLFVELVLEEKEKGKTFLMSSHSFSEIERTCDRAAIIRNGEIVTVKDIHELQSMQRKVFDVTLTRSEDVEAMKESRLSIKKTEGLFVRVEVQGDFDNFIHELSKYSVKNISAGTQSLEQIFMDYYDAEEAGS
ncbi:ABC transporter ATP-binding protein [Salimicrobium jeotgali]|uniref:ABC transporter ATP-binding protein n=1 Tax=Salimicrobium jeotgali TaxID=1230341 RepID=K2FHL5_9BACI|nr:ABC transporter ATP-binding protein [Salimicrobium jeotgali]AKG04835.1 ABC transporter ATP-binding protein [Salimicrobium jeotgali]EKE30581.1 ABC transporter ATP-binding protein [Salimicrobium jeotgali]MBM7696812.1 ABC-2 type transport system ATP-binding protein [Salimicrobium jeotgali]